MTKKLVFLISIFAFIGLFAQQTHTVSQGETAYSISKKYGISLDELYRLNPSIKDGTIAIGQKLSIGRHSTAGNAQEVGQIILQPKQTLYGITKQYHITEAEVRKLNPDLKMEIGEKVTLPLNKITKYAGNQPVVDPSEEVFVTETPAITPVEPVDAPTYSTTSLSGNYLTYTVQQGDTTFGIVNKFGLSIDELIALNPSISTGLQPGMILRVKKLDAAYVKKNSDALNVVLMLPFGYDTNDSRYRKMALEFLSGAKLAIERNAGQGKELDVKIIDAGNEATFRNSLTQLNKENTDLIIGPLFKSSVIDVLEYVKEQKIPVVAPFANSEDLYDYSNLVIIETNEFVYADRMVDEVVRAYANQKIFVIGGADKKYANYIKAKLENKLRNATIAIVNSAAEVSADTNMMTGQAAPIIAVLADSDNDNGEAFAQKMIDISTETAGNKAFSMFYVSDFESKQSQLEKASLVYIMDRKINLEGDFEKEIKADFKEKYCVSPSKYAVIGFDVVNDMLMRENDKGELFKQIDKVQTQLATKFEFVRAKPNGAYLNTGYRVIRLNP